MLEEGALLFERAASELGPSPADQAVPSAGAAGAAGTDKAGAAGDGRAAGTDKAGAGKAGAARALYLKVARTLRGGKGTPVDRLGSAFTAEVTQTLAAFPLRELMTRRIGTRCSCTGSGHCSAPGTSSSRAQKAPGSTRSGGDGRCRGRCAPRPGDWTPSPPWASTSCTCRLCIRSARRRARARTTRSQAGPDDPGSPWAIGSPAGGHDAIHPDLGTIADFDYFVARATALGLEVALDLALQASPDHPWVAKHPEWFTTRADGSIAYAENPPKKYQDIYPAELRQRP